MRTAIIPARGGSKGIPRKNLMQINGRSLVAIAIEKARKLCDVVIVSTDDDEIAHEAWKYGARVRLRPAELATDTARLHDVYFDTIESMRVRGSLLLLQCTAPLVTVDELEKCLKVSESRPIESQRLGVSALVHPFHGYVFDDGSRCINADLSCSPQRQELTRQWLIAGSAWACDSGFFPGSIYRQPIVAVECDGPYLDIDEYQDLQRARAILAREPEPCQSQHQWLVAAEALGGGAYVTDAIGVRPESTTCSEIQPREGDTAIGGGWSVYGFSPTTRYASSARPQAE